MIDLYSQLKSLFVNFPHRLFVRPFWNSAAFADSSFASVFPTDTRVRFLVFTHGRPLFRWVKSVSGTLKKIASGFDGWQFSVRIHPAPPHCTRASDTIARGNQSVADVSPGARQARKISFFTVKHSDAAAQAIKSHEGILRAFSSHSVTDVT